MGYRIAHLGDSHLGYGTRCRVHLASGINMRVRDGYLAFRETIDQILASEPDLVVHAGDVFHRSHPSVNDIAWARQQLGRLAAAGIPVIGVTGNHDFANDRGKMSATGAIHDPDRGIRMLTDPHHVFEPVDGLLVHAVSHIGLIATQRAVPEPVDGAVNVYVTHGAAQVPGHEVFACVDSPGEAVIGYDTLTMPWSVTLLGHYHGMGPLPGFHAGATGQAWYAGSSIRRGFSDPPGGRGWLLATVEDDGSVTVDRQFIAQRDQHDLPEIDASGLTGADVDERIRANLATVSVPDAIIRQRVVNCPLPTRRGVDTAALSDLTSAALVWQLEFHRPATLEFTDLAPADRAVTSLRTAGAADLPGMWTGWFADYASRAGVPEAIRGTVAAAGSQLLADASAGDAGTPAERGKARKPTPPTQEAAA